jgi:hypothetical protein
VVVRIRREGAALGMTGLAMERLSKVWPVQGRIAEAKLRRVVGRQ